MTTKSFFCALLSILMLASCSRESSPNDQSSEIRRTEDGIVVAINNADDNTKLVRLQVVSEDIIRVSATPADSFSTEESLMVLPSVQTQTRWSFTETDTTVVLSTSSLRAK